MVLPAEPVRGGFKLHPFGAAEFIRDFLMGNGPRWGVEAIDPGEGAPQTDIHAAYKEALLFFMASDLATAREEEEAAREGRRISLERIEAMVGGYLARLPQKLTSMRYHSFLIYFRMLKALGWVERTGRTEPSALQDAYPEAPPRVFYRITAAGRRATQAEYGNPLKLLYPDFDSAYFRRAREQARLRADDRARRALDLQREAR